MSLRIPRDAMVLLVGPSGSGKSTFAAQHFAPRGVLSSDQFRAMVADDPNDQTVTDDAFDLLHLALSLRLARGNMTVVDATNVERWARARLLAIARRHGRPAAAIVFALPLEVCLERNAARSDPRPPGAIRRQHSRMKASLATLAEEGFDPVWQLDDPAAVDAARIAPGQG